MELHKHRRWLEDGKFESRKYRNYTVYSVKTKALSAKLICVFVFAYAKGFLMMWLILPYFRYISALTPPGTSNLVKVNATLFRSMQPCSGQCNPAEVNATLYRPMQPCSGQCNPVQVNATLFRSMQPCFPVQVNATLFRSMQPCLGQCNTV